MICDGDRAGDFSEEIATTVIYDPSIALGR